MSPSKKHRAASGIPTGAAERPGITTARSITLAIILLVAAVVRLWGLFSYYPHFWDEAMYLAEVEGFLPHFGVNVGAFAVLKAAYVTIGRAWYPQVATAIFGLLTIIGCFLLGRAMDSSRPRGTYLGLLMAGQAALLPYCLTYSRQALATGFALCALVYALYLYVVKCRYPQVVTPRQRARYLAVSALAAGALAMVTTFAFNLLVPTGILFAAVEVFLWRRRTVVQRDQEAGVNFAGSLMIGGALFVLLPLAVMVVSGYTGWWSRVLSLSEFHAKIGTMRLAAHFLYPAHIYHLCGPVFSVTALAGLIALGWGWSKHGSAIRDARLILGMGFLVYAVFYGLFSHLQSARLYALTLPLLLYASSAMLLRLHARRPAYRAVAFRLAGAVLAVSLGYQTADYLSRSSSLRSACDVVAQRLQQNQMVYANAKAEFGYCTYTSPYHRAVTFDVISFLHSEELHLGLEPSPFVVVQDAVDLASTVASLDKRDALGEVAQVRERLAAIRSVAVVSDLVFAGRDDFSSTPYFYLEDVYSWRSYRQMRKLMPSARDSVFVYLVDPERARAYLRAAPNRAKPQGVP